MKRLKSNFLRSYHITKHIYPRPTSIDGVITSSKLFLSGIRFLKESKIRKENVR